MTRQAGIIAHLRQELGDAATAEALAGIIEADTLSWRAPVIDVAQVASVIAFTFGNRMLPNGNREPGPVNFRRRRTKRIVHSDEPAVSMSASRGVFRQRCHRKVRKLWL